MEVFKDIKGFLGRYEISNLGNVRNTTTKLLLHPRPNKEGYLRIGLRKKGSRKIYTYFIHRLVATAFIYNDDIQSKILVNHIDNDRANNSSENLEWCTPSYNTKLSFHYNKSNKGECNPRAILTSLLVAQIKELLKLNKTCKEVATLYKVSRSTIDAIKRGVNWSNN